MVYIIMGCYTYSTNLKATLTYDVPQKYNLRLYRLGIIRTEL